MYHLQELRNTIQTDALTITGSPIFVSTAITAASTTYVAVVGSPIPKSKHANTVSTSAMYSWVLSVIIKFGSQPSIVSEKLITILVNFVDNPLVVITPIRIPAVAQATIILRISKLCQILRASCVNPYFCGVTSLFVIFIKIVKSSANNSAKHHCKYWTAPADSFCIE